MVNRYAKYNFALADPVNYGLLKAKAEYSRQHPTDAEQAFMQLIKTEIPGIRFRTQFIIGNFIVDFVALKQRLIIEVDGGYHFDEVQKVNDLEREKYLKSAGFKVIRFTNEEVLNSGESVVRAVRAEL